jgi:phage-related protein
MPDAVWTVVYVNRAAEDEVEVLPADLRARFQRTVSLIELRGLQAVHEPYVKHVEDKLWEIRLSGRDGIARSLYVMATGRRVMVLRTFIKKTQKLSRREIEIALQRAREVR